HLFARAGKGGCVLHVHRVRQPLHVCWRSCSSPRGPFVGAELGEHRAGAPGSLRRRADGSAHATDTGGRSEPSRGADLGTDQGRALMIKGARFVHTNLIARDWRSLVKFYESVFGCVFVPPERNFSGAMLEA